jgi:hypothetical protein
MRPLGQTRPLLAYGVPAAAGLAVGGALAAQGEDPGSAVLGGLAAGLGARGGLGAARLAGKYAPNLVAAAQEKAVIPLGNIVGDIGRKLPDTAQKRGQVVGKAADIIAAAEGATIGPKGRQMVSKLAAGLGVPAGAAAAGLGGVALGAVPGAMGIPGFQQQQYVDPESYGSSNTMGALATTDGSMTTMRYM